MQNNKLQKKYDNLIVTTPKRRTVAVHDNPIAPKDGRYPRRTTPAQRARTASALRTPGRHPSPKKSPS